MSNKPQDLKSRTKAFAVRVIRMYSGLAKDDAIAQILGKQVPPSGTSVRSLLSDLKAAGEVSCQGKGPGARWRYLMNKGSNS